MVACRYIRLHRDRSPSGLKMTDPLALVTRFRNSLLPILEEWGGRLRNEYPAVSVNVYEMAATGMDGHGVGIDCLFKEVDLDAVDNVALCILIQQVHTSPTIHADVVWGHPSGQIEAELFDSPIAATVQRLEEVVSRLPELIAALRGALHRGFPNQGA